MVRYADDIVVGFEHQADAERFWEDMRTRLANFALTLHPEKTRLIEFGRHAAKNRRARGLGKPETFNFLGFIHISGQSRRGVFQLKRKSRSDRVRAKLQVVKEALRRRMHETIDEQGAWLRRVAMGFNAYHAVPTNSVALWDFRFNITNLWRRALKSAWSEGGGDVEADDRAAKSMASQTAHHASLAQPALRRQTPEVGARCGNTARRVLCGGRAVTRVPTAIK